MKYMESFFLVFLTIFYEDALSSKMIFIRVLRINTVNILHMIKV